MPQPEIIVEFEDKYGEKRIIHRDRNGMKLKRARITPALALNQTAGSLVGQRIKALRKKRGMTLAELCQRAGLSSSTPKSRMWEIENGVRKQGVRLGTLYAIAHALGVEATALLPSNKELLTAADVEDFVDPTPALSINGTPCQGRAAPESNKEAECFPPGFRAPRVGD